MNEIRFRGNTTIKFALISGMTLSLEVEGGIKKFYFFFREVVKRKGNFVRHLLSGVAPPPPWHSQDILYTHFSFVIEF